MNKNSDELSRKYREEIMNYYNMQKNKASVPAPAPDDNEKYPEPDLPEYISPSSRDRTDISQGTAMQNTLRNTMSDDFITRDTERYRELPEPETMPRRSLEPGPVISPRQTLEPGPVIPPRQTFEPGPVISPDDQLEPGPVIPPDDQLEPGPVIPPDNQLEPGPVIPPDDQLEPGPVIPPDTPNNPPNTSYGKLRVEVKSGNRAVPIEDALVIITKQSTTGNELLAVMLTNQNGETQTVAIPAPAEALSETPTNVTPFAKVNVNAYKKGFYEVENTDIPIFAGVTSIQPVNLIPLPFKDESQKLVFPDREPDL